MMILKLVIYIQRANLLRSIQQQIHQPPAGAQVLICHKTTQSTTQLTTIYRLSDAMLQLQNLRRSLQLALCCCLLHQEPQQSSKLAVMDVQDGHIAEAAHR